MTKKFKPFNSRAIVPGQNYDTEHNNLNFDAVSFKFSGTLSGTTGSEIRQDAPFRVLNVPELSQAEESLCRLHGISLRMISGFLAGGFSKELQPTAGGYLASALIDFEKLLPGSMVDGGRKTFIRGTAGAVADYTTATSTFDTDAALKAGVRTTDRSTKGTFTRPKYTELAIPISAANSNQVFKLDYDQALVTPGLFVRAMDANGGAGAASSIRTDGLVRRIKVEVNRGGGGQETLLDMTWGQLRAQTAELAGFNDADWDTALGFAYIPLVDEDSVPFNGRLAMAPGDTIVLTIDSASTVEPEFTAVTAAAGDELVVSRMDHEVINGRADPSAGAASALRSPRVIQVAAERGTRRRRRRSRAQRTV